MNAYLKQNTPEWLAWRKDKIGASDAPIIMGISPFKTPLQLWMLKRGEVEENAETPWMTRGKKLEGEALKAFEKETGLCMFPRVLTHKSIEWQIASFDGITLNEDNAVEIKCPGEKDHTIAKSGKIPEKYYPQLQHQMSVADLSFIYYYSYDGANGIMIKVKRNDKFIKKLYEIEKKFYECMTNSTPPEMTEFDYSERNDKSWVEKGKEWIEACKNFDLWREKKGALRDELIQESNGQSSIGGGVRLRQYFSKGLVNYSNIPELSKVDLDLYRSPKKQIWRIEAAGSLD